MLSYTTQWLAAPARKAEARDMMHKDAIRCMMIED